MTDDEEKSGKPMYIACNVKNLRIDEFHSIVKQRKGKTIHLSNIPYCPYKHFQRNSNKINQQQQNENII